ncbi:TatD family hydrolase [Hydrogenoanaerobacterium sp.]|uniref:TatD family hydrolase n=1 Tax=Hydrogenoanaerobacterium sp. TaxID=2953763 RepID=UPI00289689E4|nr:TatD family hydrolase [Hydrogenoanaerobacterium sp.]
MYRNIFDSHAHYDDERFEEDRHELLESLFANGVRGIVNAASSMESCKTSLALAQRYPQVYCAVGVHPDAAPHFTEEDCVVLAKLAKQPKVVAIGEIGLDYYYDDASPRDVQRAVFERQLQLAAELDLPVIIHDREAHQDTMELLHKYRPRGVLHCYSGSAQMAKEVVGLGMYLGFTGVLTFKNAKKAVEAAQSIPLDRLLIETDCPYMAPEPNRGRRCDSGMLVYTGSKLAELKGIDPQQLFDITCQNACDLFQIAL